MDILLGNAYETETEGTGWLIGFSDWAQRLDSDLLYVPRELPLNRLCLKWFDHPDGFHSGDTRPVSEGRTISLLVSEGSAFRIEFCASADFASGPVQRVQLKRRGDFAIWGAGLYHRSICVRRATILTVRWNISPDARVGASLDEAGVRGCVSPEMKRHRGTNVDLVLGSTV